MPQVVLQTKLVSEVIMEYIYLLIDNTFGTILAWNEHRGPLITLAEERGLKAYNIQKVFKA